MFGIRRLPIKISRPRVGFAVHLLRHAQRVAGDFPEVIAGGGAGQSEHQEHGKRRLAEPHARGHLLRGHPVLCNPEDQATAGRHSQHQAFVGTGVGQHGDPNRHQNGITHAPVAHDARQSAQHQRSARGGQSTSPIAVVPVAEYAKTQHRQHAAQQRPRRREPGLQHPADGSAHDAGAQPHSPEGMPKNHLAEGEDQSLERGIHRGIGRVKDDVEGFQMHPHRRRGIGEASMSKSVGRQ